MIRPKRLFTYPRRKTQAKAEMPVLKVREQSSERGPEDAEVFALRYSSVCYLERLTILRLSCSASALPTKDITAAKALASLKVLTTSQSPRPDNLHSSVLNEAAGVIVLTRAALFMHSLTTEK